MSNRIDPLYSFRLLEQACLGVLIGVLFAMLIAGLVLPISGHLPVNSGELLSYIQFNDTFVKSREKCFFLLTLIFCPMGAYYTTARLWNFSSIFLLLCLIASIPITNYFAQHILQQNHSYFALISLTGILAIFSVLVNRNKPSIILGTVEIVRSRFRWKPYLLLLLIMLLVMLPKSFTELAAHIGMEMHVASFLLGPSLYYLSDKLLLPGIDYLTMYSIGMGWLFSYLLGDTLVNTMTNYVYLVTIVIWLFYAQLLYLLYWLYRSWIAAAIVTLLSLILLFHTSVHFNDPSSSVLRYPLLGVCGWLLAIWIKRPTFIWYLALACSIALSVFFNTETGIIIAMAVTLGRLLTAQNSYTALLSLICLGVASLFILMLLLLVIFGPVILQGEFFRSLIEPLLFYGKDGYGSYIIAWGMNDFNWFYNLVTPGIALATLALIARSNQGADIDRPRMAVLVFFTVAGLLMLFKYVNRAIVGVWHMSSLGLLVPIVWWGMVLAWRYKKSNFKIFFLRREINFSSITWGLLIVGGIWLAAFSYDGRNPSQYGLRSWILYPSLMSSIVYKQKGCANFDCVANQPSAKDVALITERTRPGEPVAIIDFFDWTYLVSAHRPPVMFFLPSVMIYTKQQLTESLNRLKYVPYLFLVKGENKEPKITHEELKNALLPTFHDVYVFDGEGERLVAWRRKNLLTKP